MSTQRLRGNAAIAAWPERLASVHADPTEENLQRLCNLLDAVDAKVVQCWDKPSRSALLLDFRRMRAEARQANSLVTQASRSRQQAAGRANAAKRKAKAGAPADAVPAPTVSAGCHAGAVGGVTAPTESGAGDQTDAAGEGHRNGPQGE